MSYGKSHLVLNPSLRAKATYCPKDSFETCVAPHMFCTFQTLAALVAWADKDMFDKLFKAIFEGKLYTADKKEGSGNHIIEAHVFSQILFDDDLSCVRISLDELGEVKPPLTQAEVKQNADYFGTQHNVQIVYF
jgi:hypothetical protein